MNPHQSLGSMLQCFLINLHLAEEPFSNLCHVPIGSNDWIEGSAKLCLFCAGGVCIIPDIVHHSVVQSRYWWWSHCLARKITGFILGCTWDLSLRRQHHRLLEFLPIVTLAMIPHEYCFLPVANADVVFESCVDTDNRINVCPMYLGVYDILYTPVYLGVFVRDPILLCGLIIIAFVRKKRLTTQVGHCSVIPVIPVEVGSCL